MTANIFLAITGRGLARASHDSYDEWSVEILLPDQDVRCLAANPANPQVIYAGTLGNGVFRSDVGGKTWYAAGLTGQIIKAPAVNPVSPSTFYTGTKPDFLFAS